MHRTLFWAPRALLTASLLAPIPAAAVIEGNFGYERPIPSTTWYGAANPAALAADRAYIAGMRPHHAGALTMSRDYLQDPAASSPARPTMGKACSWITTGMSASVPTARTVWRRLTAHTGSRSSAAPESGTLMGVHRAIGPVPTRTSKASGASASRSHSRAVGINAPS